MTRKKHASGKYDPLKQIDIPLGMQDGTMNGVLTGLVEEAKDIGRRHPDLIGIYMKRMANSALSEERKLQIAREMAGISFMNPRSRR